MFWFGGRGRGLRRVRQLPQHRGIFYSLLLFPAGCNCRIPHPDTGVQNVSQKVVVTGKKKIALEAEKREIKVAWNESPEKGISYSIRLGMETLLEAEPMLDVLDEQLVQFGSVIMKRRMEFVKELNEIIRTIHSNLSGGKEELAVEYEIDTTIEEFAKNRKNFFMMQSYDY